MEKEDKTIPERSSGKAHALRRYPPPQETLDLHGCTGPEAAEKTETFVQKARYKGKRTLRVIVGKGLHSEGPAVLPDVVEEKLSELKKRQWIFAFEWEKGDKKRSGSLIVYLKTETV